MDEGVNVSALEFELVRYVWAISSTTLLTDLCYDKIRCHRNTSAGILTPILMTKQSCLVQKRTENKKEFGFPGHHNGYFD